MTSASDQFDLPGIADEAQVEILRAEAPEATEVAPLDAGTRALETAEFGYYEAELSSLRDAALTLNESEHNPG